MAGFFRSWSQCRRFRRLPPELRNLVFYSEGRNDWHHFEPLIDVLTRQLGRTVCYVTSDSGDPGLERRDDRVLGFCIGRGFWRIVWFQTLQADVLALTMLDLHNYELKRSVHPVHYAYLFHAMGSTHMVDPENAYDHYDSIFCVGPHQVREIRRREAMKNLPAKHLFACGYPRLDMLLGRRDAADAEDRADGRHGPPPERPADEPATVLVAPTWGAQSILNVCGLPLVASLLEAGFRVVLRPHYETVKRSPEVVKAILERFGRHPRLRYVDLMGESESLFTSDVLVCDWSSTAIEYALGLEKPVLFVDVPRRVRNPRYGELGLEPLEVSIRAAVGEVLDPREVDKAPACVARLLASREQFRRRVPALREQWAFNVGCSAAAGAGELARIAGERAQSRPGKARASDARTA